MTHRYAAGALALVILVIAALAISARRARVASVPFALALLATVIVQAILGMLTVTPRLEHRGDLEATTLFPRCQFGP